MRVSEQIALIIDDDPSIGILLSAYLKGHGFAEVISVHNVAVAQKILAEHGCDIAMVVTDLKVGSGDGLEILHELSCRGFKGQVAIISGVESALIDNAVKFARQSHLNTLGGLRKPFTKANLDGLFLSDADLPAKQTTHSSLAVIREKDLETALKNGEIIPFYQPKIEVLSGRVVGAEALARWQHPELGLISPAVFIPLAETSGLIDPITFSIFEQVVQDTANIFTGLGGIKLASNFSPGLLCDPNLPRRLSNILEAEDLSASRFCLEITESGIIDSAPIVLQVLTRLRLMGFSLSIDDFGTGGSNLENLRKYPYTELKIDQSFICSMKTDEFSMETVKSSIAFARRLGMQIVAEGVEDSGTLSDLKGLGVDEVQGYLVAKPVPANQVVEYFKDRFCWLKTA